MMTIDTDPDNTTRDNTLSVLVLVFDKKFENNVVSNGRAKMLDTLQDTNINNVWRTVLGTTLFFNLSHVT